MKSAWLAAAAAILFASACTPQERAPGAAQAAGEGIHYTGADALGIGRHISIVGGCNDCHTQDFNIRGLAIPESERLLGSNMGHYGPWGTSYASNLRIVAASMSEDEWVEMMRTRNGLPPMPWEIIHHYSAEDMRALHQYIRSLGDVGQPVPTALPPGPPPPEPYTDYLTHAGPPPAAPPG
ncbi:MAG: cytochrome C [Hyphomonadaceae bacterium]